MKDNEHRLQVQCVQWFRLQYPNHLIFAIPNGSQRNIITATRLKAEGVVSGVPDLCIAASRRGCSGLYIELKIKPNKPSSNQIAIIEKLTDEGYDCHVIYDFETFVKTVNWYFG